MNDRSDKTADIKKKCKEVSGSHIIKRKKRCKNIGKPLNLLAQQMIHRWEYNSPPPKWTVVMYRKYLDFIFGSIFG